MLYNIVQYHAVLHNYSAISHCPHAIDEVAAPIAIAFVAIGVPIAIEWRRCNCHWWQLGVHWHWWVCTAHWLQWNVACHIGNGLLVAE